MCIYGLFVILRTQANRGLCRQHGRYQQSRQQVSTSICCKAQHMGVKRQLILNCMSSNGVVLKRTRIGTLSYSQAPSLYNTVYTLSRQVTTEAFADAKVLKISVSGYVTIQVILGIRINSKSKTSGRHKLSNCISRRHRETENSADFERFRGCRLWEGL